MKDARNDPYRAASPPPEDDRVAIADAFARLRAQAFVAAYALVALVALACVALAVVSRGRWICFVFPFIPFIVRGGWSWRRFGWVFPGRDRFVVRSHALGVDVEVGALRALLTWEEIASASARGPEHGRFGLSGSAILELESGLVLGIPATAMGYDGLLRDLGERRLLSGSQTHY